MKKHGPNERTDQNSRKRAKQNGDKQSIRCRVQNMVIRMLKELSESLSSIKEIQSEMKDTLIEIKNNLQGNNIRMEEVENQINDLEYKEVKNSQSEQQEEKRIQKNKDKPWSLCDNFKHTNI